MKIIENILSIGIEDQLSFKEANRVRLTNQMALYGLLFLCIDIISNLIFGLWLPILSVLSMVLTFSFAIYINHLRYYQCNRLIILLVPIVFLTFQTFLFGQKGALSPFFIIIIVSAFFLFDNNKVRLSVLGCAIIGYSIGRLSSSFIIHPLEDKVYPLTQDLNYGFTVLATVMIVGLTLKERDNYLKSIEKQRDQLVKQNKELENFVHIASHDLKTPLQNISNFSGLIQRSIDKNELKDLQTYSSFIGGNAQRMIRLIEDLRIYTQIENREESKGLINLNNTLLLATQQLRPYIESKKAIIKNEGLPKNYRANQKQMILLFNNILENAIKYNDSAIPEINISCQEKKGFWEIAFQDNGIGFDLVFKEKIFQMFQRLHNAHEYSGSGIGLSICRRIGEYHDATISVQSEKGRGAVFLISLPIQKKSPNQMIEKQNGIILPVPKFAKVD